MAEGRPPALAHPSLSSLRLARRPEPMEGHRDSLRKERLRGLLGSKMDSSPRAALRKGLTNEFAPDDQPCVSATRRRLLRTRRNCSPATPVALRPERTGPAPTRSPPVCPDALVRTAARRRAAPTGQATGSVLHPRCSLLRRFPRPGAPVGLIHPKLLLGSGTSPVVLRGTPDPDQKPWPPGSEPDDDARPCQAVPTRRKLVLN
jgi:hypothetical protein